MSADPAADKRARLLQQLRDGKAPPTAPSAAGPRARARVPLTRGQEQMWLDCQLAPDEPVYNEAVMIRRTGRCDVGALRRAFNLVLSRHEAWRTNFASEDGQPYQIIRPHADHPLPLVDLSSVPEPEREARAMTIAVENARPPFDLENDPLVRPLLVRVSEADHRLYLTLHHLIFDGVALRLLLSETVQAYGALAAGRVVELPDLPAPYTHYACWEHQNLKADALEPRLAFWRDRLRGAPPVELPPDRAPPSDRTRNGAMARTFVDRATLDRLREVARHEGATFFLVLLTAYATVLHRYSGQDDLVIAALVDGRRHRALENLMGFMINPLPVRVDVSGDPSFAELLGRVRDSFLTGLANEVPFGELLRALSPDRDSSRNPIFQAMFSLDPPLPPLGDGWELDEIDVEFTAAKCDLQLLQDEREAGAVGRFVYSTDLFEADTWTRLAERWRVLLEGIAVDPSCRISALPFLSDAERALLDEWNRTDAPYPASSCVHELFEEQARARPDSVAVVQGDRQLTYGELDALADRLAGRLRGLGVGRDAPVGLCAERGPEMVAAVLGIMKAGGAYVPLDPAYPTERLAFMVDDAGTARAREPGAPAVPAAADERGDRLCRRPRPRAGGGRERGSGRAPGRPGVRHLYVGLDRRAEGRDDRAPGGRQSSRRSHPRLRARACRHRRTAAFAVVPPLGAGCPRHAQRRRAPRHVGRGRCEGSHEDRRGHRARRRHLRAELRAVAPEGGARLAPYRRASRRQAASAPHVRRGAARAGRPPGEGALRLHRRQPVRADRDDHGVLEAHHGP